MFFHALDFSQVSQNLDNGKAMYIPPNLSRYLMQVQIGRSFHSLDSNQSMGPDLGNFVNFEGTGVEGTFCVQKVL